jgi:hypothetical protein
MEYNVAAYASTRNLRFSKCVSFYLVTFASFIAHIGESF